MIRTESRLDSTLRQRVEAILLTLPDLEAAWIHGSAVRGELRDDSDLDIALLLRPGARLPAAAALELTGRLVAAAGRPVDLGLLSAADVVYAVEAMLSGVGVALRNPTAAAQRRAEFMAMRVELERQRQPVIDAYTA